MKERYGDPPDEAAERLEYDLGVIKGTGYAGYFLTVQDFIAWVREQGTPVGPGRRSAAGSLVAYALGITKLDPIRSDLLFERFLNPERVSMPDVDIDFYFERRGEVIEYTRQKYGSDAGFMQAAGIGTYFLHLDGVAQGRRRRVRRPDSPWEELG